MTQSEGDSSCLHVHKSGRDSSSRGSMDTASASSSTTATTTPAPILLSLEYCILIQTMAKITEVHHEWCPAWNTASMDYQIDLETVSIPVGIVALRDVDSSHISKMAPYFKTSSNLNSGIVHNPSHRTNGSANESTGQATSSQRSFETETSDCPVEELPTLNVEIQGIAGTVRGVRYGGLYPNQVNKTIRLAGLLCFPFGSKHFIFHMLPCDDGELFPSSELGVKYAQNFNWEASGCTIYSPGKPIIRANNIDDSSDGTSFAEFNYRTDASGNSPLAQNVLQSWTVLAIGTQKRTMLLVLEKSKESF